MPDTIEDKSYPFSLADVFFVSLNFRRMPKMPEPLEININAQTKVVLESYPEKLQVNLKLITPEDSPLTFSIETVGMFDYTGDDPEKDKSLIALFIANRGLHMMWGYLKQLIQIITGQMGMRPINLSIPVTFDLKEIEAAIGAEKKRSN